MYRDIQIIYITIEEDVLFYSYKILEHRRLKVSERSLDKISLWLIRVMGIVTVIVTALQLVRRDSNVVGHFRRI